MKYFILALIFISTSPKGYDILKETIELRDQNNDYPVVKLNKRTYMFYSYKEYPDENKKETLFKEISKKINTNLLDYLFTGSLFILNTSNWDYTNTYNCSILAQLSTYIYIIKKF